MMGPFLKKEVFWMNRLKVWISEHQRMIVMGVAAFIILCVGCLVIREYQLKRVYNQAISYYEENDLIAIGYQLNMARTLITFY